MKLKQLMMLLLLLLTTSIYAQGDSPFEEVENKLPSEVTMQEMQQHTWRPSLEAIAPDANLYVDNRFFLDMKRSATGIDTEAEAATKNIYLSCNNSQLSLQASILVESIDIYNLQGQVLKTALTNRERYAP